MNHKDNRQEIVLAAGRVYDNVSLDDPTPADKLPCYGFTLLRPMEGGVFPLQFESEVKKAGWSNRLILQNTEGALLNLLTGIYDAKMRSHYSQTPKYRSRCDFGS